MAAAPWAVPTFTYRFWPVCWAVDATVRCDTTVEPVIADSAALDTIAVPPADGAVNKPAAAVVRDTLAFVKITLLTLYEDVLLMGNTVSPVAFTFTPW